MMQVLGRGSPVPRSMARWTTAFNAASLRWFDSRFASLGEAGDHSQGSG
jgi:hypothetical protein